MADFFTELSKLSLIQSNKSAIDMLIEKYGLQNIIQKIKTIKLKGNECDNWINLMQFIVKNQEYFKKFIFPSNDTEKEVMQEYLQHEKVEIRELLAIGILANFLELHLILKSHLNDSQIFIEYISVLFYLLKDPESSVGLKILKVIEQFAVEENKLKTLDLFKNKEVIQELQTGIMHENSEVKIRFMELICFVANFSAMHDLMKTSGLLQNALDVYLTDDLLLKLSAVEILVTMGNSKLNSEFLCNSNQKIFNLIQKDAFDENQQFYVRKYLLLLLSKLISNSTILFNTQIKANFKKFILQCFEANQNEQIEGAFEIISAIVQSQTGIDFLFEDKKLFGMYMEFLNSINNIVKTKFMNSFAQIFSLDPIVKNQSNLKAIWSSFGDSSCMFKEDFENSTNKAQETQAMQALFSYLQSAFMDIEVQALIILQGLIHYKFGIIEFCSHANSIEYLLKSYSKSKEIFDRKRDVIDYLRNILPELSATEPILKEFYQNFKILQIQPAQKQSDNPIYQTDLN